MGERYTVAEGEGMKAKLVKSTAGRDECCTGCGYPFDTDDWVWRGLPPNEHPYCSKACAEDVKKEGEEEK
jgi:hypothetical protein